MVLWGIVVPVDIASSPVLNVILDAHNGVPIVIVQKTAEAQIATGPQFSFISAQSSAKPLMAYSWEKSIFRKMDRQSVIFLSGIHISSSNQVGRMRGRSRRTPST